MKEDIQEVVDDPDLNRVVINEGEELKRKQYGKYALNRQAIQKNKEMAGKANKDALLTYQVFQS
jgi:hypothetical protein